MSKPTLAIIGTGWAGYTLSQHLSPSKFTIHIISPLRTIQYTPLLASAACGLFDFRLAEEPVRRRTRASVHYHTASAQKINFEKRTIMCKPAVEDLDRSGEFEVSYDKIVIAPGCGIQTFGTPGAEEHALFLRTTDDARAIQRRMLEVLDAASLPDISEEQQREMLNIRVVGGGAIGIEATAEIYDLWHEDMRFLYPHLDGKLTITIHDVAPTILSTFDQSLGDYALKSLHQKNVQIKTSSHIERVENDAIYTKEEGRMAYGMLIWAKGLPRILTDKYLRLLRPDGSAMEDAYALGDAADIDGHSLPTLAEVALQKGEYLSRELNNGDQPSKPFEYKQRALMAYLGQHDGIVGGRSEWTGESAWLAWRSGSLAWTRSWRRKIMISLSWVFVWFGGRDIARR
jgi:NADH:ubiquinone reductase (non-electrogenic)